MANITGTNGNDKLIGTAANDIIKGLGGNDLIIASEGWDTIDGGAGYDTVDYTNPLFDDSYRLGLDNLTGSLQLSRISNSSFRGITDNLTNIETILIGKKQALFRNSILFETAQKVDVDLSKNRLTYSLPSFETKTITLNNFQDISTGAGNDRIKGNDLDNEILAGVGNDTVIGSKGNDNFFGSDEPRVDVNGTSEINTLDYSSFGSAIALGISPFSRFSFSIEKGSFGSDRAESFQRIIGANKQTNTIQGEPLNFGVPARLDVNLAKNLFTNTSGDVIEIINFVNVIGGRSDDLIVGGNKNSELTGGGGNDTITGGNRNDIITGSNSNARGVGEFDTITGGGGRDKFVLGDANGAYYVGIGKNDCALITDFNLFQDSIDLGGFKDYSFASGGNNTIELYSGKDVNTRDLIAKIQLAGGISNRSTNSRSIAGSNFNLDAIISKVDILSGSTANT